MELIPLETEAAISALESLRNDGFVYTEIPVFSEELPATVHPPTRFSTEPARLPDQLSHPRVPKQGTPRPESAIQPADMASLLENQDDLAKSRAAYLRLQKVLKLNPERSEARSLLQKATQNFVPNSAQYAPKLADIKDLSRIATATVLKYDVQRLMNDLITQEELKSAAVPHSRAFPI